MANFEYEELPKLPETHAQPFDEPLDSKSRRLVSRTQSELISVPRSSMEPYWRETSRVRHTGSFRSERKASFVQMRGLYATPGTGNLMQLGIVVTDNRAKESKTDEFATFHSTGSNYRDHGFDQENEHLLRSGQLGMCSDPYCTTCPTHFKTSHLRNPKASTIFDPKVFVFLPKIDYHFFFFFWYIGGNEV